MIARMERAVHSVSHSESSFGAIVRAAAFRWLCFALMTVAAVLNESVPGRKLDDPLLSVIPFVPFVERWNYWLWLVAWIPGTFALLAIDRARFVRLMLAGGISSLLRGLCIIATSLGPVRGDDINSALPWDLDLYLRVIGQILDPFAVFVEHSASVWLTKDLFFSGHTESTLLLVLYSWRHPRLRNVGLALHGVVVLSLFLGHIHYTIDVIGGWVAAIFVFFVMERLLGNERSTAVGDREVLPVESR